ncbi:hypothetical protein KVF89_21165 [Nocardioides carbamazepini]|uniref:acyl-CoA dehydrogenase n=1 Tax=Nocardioides carbamazepini TaxID=2854259 RepID=UPI002149E51D|nr:acyl-CoA dehydrogenase [Nocardioides carbamazepini]MCR1785063.1 hypothetical protein [Nocardioides carbamazepini]
MAADHQELDDLQTAAREVFADLSSSEDVHRVIDTGPGRDAALERQLTGLGFYSVLLPGEDGDLAHLARIVVEAGAATATTRLLGHAVGLGTALAAVPDSPTRTRVLDRVAGGATGAVLGTTGGFRHRADGASRAVEGAEAVVPDADADLLLIWSEGDDGPRLWAVDASRAERTDLAPIDRTRLLGAVWLPATPVTDDDLLAAGADAARARTAVRRALELALAFDSLGVARRALALTVAYVSTREQFGRPVGSFQAVQHQAADMAVRTELAQAVCDAALAELLDGATQADATIAMAREVACAGASWVAGRAIQLHGGIGYTWEHDAHILLKRAKLNEALVTSARDRRRVVLDALAPADLETAS